MTKKYNYVDDFDKRYITTYTLKDGEKYTETSYNYPDLANYICPHCGTYPMKYHEVDLGEWDGWRTEFGCVACMSRYEEGDKSLKPAPIRDFDDIVEVVYKKDVKPTPRNIRYTPEFIEKATKAMRDTPLKRQHIRVHEDDMESTCPACGYMLYEEANMIFNYCPTCGQALNNNDFSEEDK